MRVAFLGLGRIGRPMAAHLPAAGHELTVWNRSPGKAADLVALGAREAGTIAEAVDGAEAVIVMVFGPEASAAVTKEVFSLVPAGTLVIDASTIGVLAAQAAGKAAAAAGVRYVDAPVIGTVKPAADGVLGVVAGGSLEDYAAAEPLLQLWGDPAKVRRVGEVGAGNALKLVVNLTLGVAMGAVGEALQLADDLGLDRAATLDVLATGPLGFTVGQKRGMLAADDYSETAFSLDLMLKDLDLALTAADHDMPLTAAVRQLAQAAADAGLGDEDFTALAGHLLRTNAG